MEYVTDPVKKPGQEEADKPEAEQPVEKPEVDAPVVDNGNVNKPVEDNKVEVENDADKKAEEEAKKKAEEEAAKKAAEEAAKKAEEDRLVQEAIEAAAKEEQWIRDHMKQVDEPAPQQGQGPAPAFFVNK